MGAPNGLYQYVERGELISTRLRENEALQHQLIPGVCFKAFYGHYGGAAIDAAGRLHAAWGAGEPGYRTGGVWVNRVEGAVRVGVLR